MKAFVQFTQDQFGRVDVIFNNVVVPTGAVYCATKYAVRAISEGLRQESQTIRVTTISPGVVETELGSDITGESAKRACKTSAKFLSLQMRSPEQSCTPSLNLMMLT